MNDTSLEIFMFAVCAAVLLIFLGLFGGCNTVSEKSQHYNKSTVIGHACVMDGKQLRCEGE